MRQAGALFLSAVAATMGCALVGYDLDGYGPKATSTAGGGGTAGSGGTAGGPSGQGASSGTASDASTGAGNASMICGGMPFKERVDTVLGLPPVSLHVALMNSDSAFDVVIAHEKQGVVSVLLNDGTGMLRGGELKPLTGSEVTSVAVANFNKESRPDVVVTDSAKTEVHLLLNTGEGKLSPPTSISTSSACFGLSDVVTGEFNRDTNSFTDIAVACSGFGSTGAVVILPGDGTMGLGLPTVVLASKDATATSLAAANLNSDSLLDLVVAGWGTEGKSGDEVVALIAGPMDYTPVHLIVGSPRKVAIETFNNDSFPDIAVATGSLEGALFLGQGASTFNKISLPLNFGVATWDIVATDLNRDDLVDIAASSDTSVIVLFGKGDGSFYDRIELPGLIGGQGLEAADLNGDGWTDLIEGSSVVASLRVFFNTCAPLAP